MAKENKSKISIILAAIIIVVTIIYVLFIRPNYYFFNGKEIFFEPIFAESFVLNETYEMYTYQQNVYICTRNGLKKISINGDRIWDKVFNLNNPKLYTNNQYMSVVDITGKKAYLFDNEGLLKEYSFEYPIIMASLSSEGVLAVVQEMDNRHLIQIYNREGKLVAKRGTSFAGDGYPIGIDLSSTGEYMVTSYLTVKEGSIHSVISFFNFGELGESSPEKILGGFVLEGTVAPEVTFLDDQSVVVVGDNMLNFYHLDKIPNLEKQIPIYNEIEKIAYMKRNIIVSFGERVLPQDEDLENKVIVYNNEGKTIDEYPVQDKIQAMFGTDQYYYLVKQNTIEQYSSRGMNWRTTTYKEPIQIFKIDKNKYLMVYPHGYEILKVKEV